MDEEVSSGRSVLSLVVSRLFPDGQLPACNLSPVDCSLVSSVQRDREYPEQVGRAFARFVENRRGGGTADTAEEEELGAEGSGENAFHAFVEAAERFEAERAEVEKRAVEKTRQAEVVGAEERDAELTALAEVAATLPRISSSVRRNLGLSSPAQSFTGDVSPAGIKSDVGEAEPSQECLGGPAPAGPTGSESQI